MRTGCDCLRNSYKKCSGRIDAESTVDDVRGRHDAIVRSWNVQRELKHRLWHPFWQSLLLKKCGDDVAGRMLELMEMTHIFGIKRIRDHWSSAEADADVRQYAIERMEGVDVYCTPEIATALDGDTNTITNFGKMYVDRYPFRCVMVYDDGGDDRDVTYIHSDKVRRLVQLNKRPDIIKKREFREDLRGCSGKVFNSADERMQTFTVQDGVDIVKYQEKVVDGKDGDGNEISHMEDREKVSLFTVTFL